MLKNYRDLLIELGFRPSELDTFMQKQREYEPYYRKAVEFNKQTLGSGTAIQPFSYKSLYDYTTNTFKTASKSKPLSASTTSSTLKRIQKYQEQSMRDQKTYGMTKEVADTIRQAVKVLNTYQEVNINSNDVLHTVKQYHSDNYEDFIMELNEYLDIIYRYEQTERGKHILKHSTSGSGFNALTALQTLLMA